LHETAETELSNTTDFYNKGFLTGRCTCEPQVERKLKGLLDTLLGER